VRICGGRRVRFPPATRRSTVALSRASAVREDGGEASVGVVQAGY
jgi:hypothetical protein